MREQRPRIKVHPVGDGADVDIAQKIGGLIRHIETRSDASVAYDTGGESAVKIGWGYWRVLSEWVDEKSTEQELKLAPIRNSFTVYVDPAAQLPSAEDMEWCIVSEKMKRSEFERKYPDQNETEWREGGAGDCGPDWETQEEIRLAEYFRITRIPDEALKLTNGENVLASEYKERREEYDQAGIKIAEDRYGREIRRATHRRQIEWYRLNGSTVVEHVDLPGKWIPIIRCEGNVLDLNGEVRRKGMVEDLMDTARMYNYWRELSLDTPVTTPNGWSTIGALKVGDEVYTEDGKPTRVIGKSNVKIHERCYKITFGDGSQVTAAWDHPWPVEERGKRKSSTWEWTAKIVNTAELTPKKHFIPVTKPLECAHAELPIHPYLLGLWLGDGTAAEPNICPGDEDIDEVREKLVELGHSLGPVRRSRPQDHGVFTVLGVRHLFTQLGLLGRKHVPTAYLRASVDQRWALLRGFMDSDGSIGKANRQCSYTTTSGAIAAGFMEVVRSLGIRLSVIKRAGRRSKLVGSDSVVQDFYQFSFSCYADEPVFGLSRKAALLPHNTEHRRRTKRHSIVKVEAVASVPLQCIGIDTPTHLFLCGGSMIPTRNTCETEMIALAPRAPWVGTADQFDGHPEWNDANQKPYSKLMYTPAFLENPDGSKVPLPPPQRVETVQIPAGFVNAAESAAKDLMALAGMPHEPGMDQPGSVVSGIALRRRQALSDIGHFQYYDNQTRAICHTGRILLDLIPHYYSEERMQRIVGEDGVPSVVKLNERDPSLDKIKNDVTVGRYDVIMDTGPAYQTKREEGAEQLIDLLKIAPVAEIVAKNGADLLFRSVDGPYMDQLADRVMPMNPQGMEQVLKDLPKQAQNIVMSLQQQNQQLQQKIQQQALEIKYKSQIEQGWMQVEREKTQQQTQVKANDAALRAHTAATDVHTKAQASIAVAEINSAGRLLDTHTEAMHNRAAARELSAAAEQAERLNGA